MAQCVSGQTRRNWWIDAMLLSSALVASLSGVYFLFVPLGGYRGGRNPMFGVEVLFSRGTWGDLHTWSGVAMIGAALIHVAVHWPWLVSMGRRLWAEVIGQRGRLTWGGRWNLVLDLTVGLCFVLTAVTAVYFLFVPGGRAAADPMFLFPRTTWDLLHTWAGVALISGAVIHFAIHWRWVANVSRKMLGRGLHSHSARPPAELATQ